MHNLTERKRAKAIINILKKEYGSRYPFLKSANPIQTLVATILSAQCTDKRIESIMDDLFIKYQTVDDYANTDLKALENIIRPAGLYRAKAKYIKRTAQMIIENFNSKVPSTMDELLTLPGVARKTANIVLTHGFNIVKGIAVDTHVKRVSYRLFLTEYSNPDKIEKDLMKIFSQKEWGNINYLFIMHGRKICRSQRPSCRLCVISKLCPSAFLV